MLTLAEATNERLEAIAAVPYRARKERGAAAVEVLLECDAASAGAGGFLWLLTPERVDLGEGMLNKARISCQPNPALPDRDARRWL